MNLYEIKSELYNCIDENGEIIDFEKLDELAGDFNGKVGNIARWIVNLDAEAKACKERKEVFAQRQKAAENKSASLKNYLAGVLDGQKWQDEDVKISWRKSQSVDVYGDIPEEYVITETVSRPDKLRLKEALKGGEIIEGCRLIEKNNISVK